MNLNIDIVLNRIEVSNINVSNMVSVLCYTCNANNMVLRSRNLFWCGGCHSRQYNSNKLNKKN
jgi:hypothetical protein